VHKFIAMLAVLVLLASCSSMQVVNGVTTSKGYEPQTGILYNDATGLVLDVYAPPNAQDAPVVVFFYGGRWSGGIRSEYKFVGQALTQQGFIVVVPDVRAYPKVRFPTFVEDAAKAVKWTRDNIGKYGGSPDKLFVMGHQSGAHIAAMLALDEEFLKGVGGSRKWLRGMIGLAGPYDFELNESELRDMFGPPDAFYKSQPIHYVDGHNPPLLLLHGEDDTDVLVKNTRNLAAAVVRAGGAVETVFYPQMQNNWILATIAAPLRKRSDVLTNITEFVRKNAVPPPVPVADPLAPDAATPLQQDVDPSDLQTQPLR
jgi:acetyl esterase/lipase